MQTQHQALPPEEVIARGRWDPRCARVLAIADDEDYGFALVDGNGDGAELEAEAWIWEGGTWTGAGSSGAGPLSRPGPVSSVTDRQRYQARAEVHDRGGFHLVIRSCVPSHRFTGVTPRTHLWQRKATRGDVGAPPTKPGLRTPRRPPDL